MHFTQNFAVLGWHSPKSSPLKGCRRTHSASLTELLRKRALCLPWSSWPIAWYQFARLWPSKYEKLSNIILRLLIYSHSSNKLCIITKITSDVQPTTKVSGSYRVSNRCIKERGRWKIRPNDGVGRVKEGQLWRIQAVSTGQEISYKTLSARWIIITDWGANMNGNNVDMNFDEKLKKGHVPEVRSIWLER